MISHDLSIITGISNQRITEYYWYLENIVMYRKLIKCVPVNNQVGEDYLTEMSESLILMTLVKFKKENLIDSIGISFFK